MSSAMNRKRIYIQRWKGIQIQLKEKVIIKNSINKSQIDMMSYFIMNIILYKNKEELNQEQTFGNF